MIGFYNYTVILTYMSLISAITGMTFAHAGVFGAAIFCLALSGFFDMFDGKVARRKKDRTDDEKLFGIQLDSLCDVVAFGVFPAYLCYCTAKPHAIKCDNDDKVCYAKFYARDGNGDQDLDIGEY